MIDTGEDNVIFQSQGIEISEDKSNPDYLNCLFRVCDFNANANNVFLNRDTIESWLSTIVGSPLVAKITRRVSGSDDFGSHEYKVVNTKDENGNVFKKAIFDTEAFGYCTDAFIDADKSGKEYIYANYKVWKRFERACKIIKARAKDLNTSWEISVEKSTKEKSENAELKRIDKGRFIGLAMLGATVTPAYSTSGLLEVASCEESELVDALAEDLMCEAGSHTKSVEKEEKENAMDNEISVKIEEEVSAEVSEATDDFTVTIEDTESASENEAETSAETEEAAEDEAKDEDKEKDSEQPKTEEESECKKDKKELETSALTECEARNKITEAIRESVKGDGYISFWFVDENVVWFKTWDSSELDFLEVKFSYSDDESGSVIVEAITPVTLTVKPREFVIKLSEKDSAIASMNEKINSLSKEVAELKPYKEAAEKVEYETKKQNLVDYATRSNLISADECESDETIKEAIASLNKAGIDAVIASRYMSSLSAETESNEKTTEVSSVKKAKSEEVSADIMPEITTNFNIVKSYINS